MRKGHIEPFDRPRRVGLSGGRHRQKAGPVLVGALQRCPLGYILTYFDSTQPKYSHLVASMLGYDHINLISMLKRFEPEEVVRGATDTLVIQKSTLHKLKRRSGCAHDKRRRALGNAAAKEQRTKRRGWTSAVSRQG